MKKKYYILILIIVQIFLLFTLPEWLYNRSFDYCDFVGFKESLDITLYNSVGRGNGVWEVNDTICLPTGPLKNNKTANSTVKTGYQLIKKKDDKDLIIVDLKSDTIVFNNFFHN